MTYRLTIRPEAETELAEAFDWYERRVPGLGVNFLTAVDVAVESILTNPFQYPLIYRSVHRALMRRFPYQVLFLVEQDLVIIIGVFHGARDPKRWQERV
jgi:plasmid stabilization system protein ParE